MVALSVISFCLLRPANDALCDFLCHDFTTPLLCGFYSVMFNFYTCSGVVLSDDDTQTVLGIRLSWEGETRSFAADEAA